MANIYEVFKFPDITDYVNDVCQNEIGITIPPNISDEEYNALPIEQKNRNNYLKHNYWDWYSIISHAWKKGYIEGRREYAKSLYDKGICIEDIAKIMEQSKLAIELLLEVTKKRQLET